MSDPGDNGTSKEPSMLLEGPEARDLYVKNIVANITVVNGLIFMLANAIAELRTAMFLTGSKNLEQLHRCPVAVTGKTREWLVARGLLS